MLHEVSNKYCIVGSLERKFTEFNSKRHKEDVEKPLLPLTIPAAASNDLTISNKLRKVEVGEVFKVNIQLLSQVN